MKYRVQTEIKCEERLCTQSAWAWVIIDITDRIESIPEDIVEAYMAPDCPEGWSQNKSGYGYPPDYRHHCPEHHQEVTTPKETE